MSDSRDPVNVASLAAEIDARIQALSVRNSPNVRTVRREYTKQLKNAPADFVLALATMLLHAYGYRGTGSIAYELISYHSPAFVSLGVTKIEALGQGIDSWHSVDGFARLISGPAWLKGLISDDVIHRWALSPDLWWRRAALVSTVALNMRSHGGYGDVDRTLAVCRMLVDDHEDMVVKALSWALRQLVVHDPEAVRAFLSEHEEQLAARVKREVRNKLKTGLKNPKGNRP
jgi:3-methyladenine DNA glycosylase AlkD